MNRCSVDGDRSNEGSKKDEDILLNVNCRKKYSVGVGTCPQPCFLARDLHAL